MQALLNLLLSQRLYTQQIKIYCKMKMNVFLLKMSASSDTTGPHCEENLNEEGFYEMLKSAHQKMTQARQRTNADINLR